MPLSDAELDRLYSTELTAAVKKEDLDEVRRLLDAGADPNACGAGDAYPVCHAAVKGMDAIFDALVAAGADPVQEHGNGVLTIHLAGRNNRTGILERILDAKPEYIDIPDGEGKTPLHHAASNGQVDAAVTLLRRGADKTAVDYDGYDVLTFADSIGQHDFVKGVTKEMDRIAAEKRAVKDAANQAEYRAGLDDTRKKVSQIRKLGRRLGM